jgi:tRNA A-37 threonylcarbamoyl transferase component Bud32
LAIAARASELKRLGRYEIESVLGKGAMGIVYAGIDSRLQRKVAIKTILKSALDEDTAREYSMRFDREARAVARLNHPNIVQVYDFGEEADIAYIVMEFIKGRELKAFFDARERFEPKEIVHIMGDLCDALHFAHESGIIHRDIKPANVMIDTHGRVKLADFGVARITDADRGVNEKTQAGAVVGTPAYMSPEQIEGGEIDRRTDIFSAGVVLYQFLTGEKPFTGEGAWTVAKKILQDDPPRPSSINKTISPAFDAVVNKALAKKVDARYQTARELGIALKKALEGKGTEDDDRTVVGSFTAGPAPAAVDDDATIIGAQAPMARTAASPAESSAGHAIQATATQEMDLEFWRSIKDGDDPNDFDLYVQQFPIGIYTALAKRKSAKLRGQVSEDSTTKAAQAQEAERREIEDAARREAEVKAKLAEEKAKLEAELARREAELQQRAAEAEARREAEAKERAEAEARTKAEFEAKLAKREAEMQEREALAKRREEEAKQREEEAARIQKELATKKRGPVVVISIAVLVAAMFVAYVALRPAPTISEADLIKMLDQAKRANAELLAAKEREQEMLKELDRARVAEADARASGDVEKQRQMAELTRQREADLQKQAELIKRREAEAQKQAELAKQRQAELEKLLESRKAAEAKKQEAQKQAAEKAAAEKAAAEKAAAEKAAAEKLAAERAAAQKAAAERSAAEQRAAAERAAAERAAAERAAAEKAAAEKAAAEKAAAEKLAAEKAAAEKAAAEAQRRLVEKGTGAAAAAAKAVEKAAAQAASGEKVATLDVAATLLKQGESAESSGDLRAAVKFYRDAARNGSGQAAKLLGDIYSNGKGDVGRDYQESLRWYAIAERAGIKVERARAR